MPPVPPSGSSTRGGRSDLRTRPGASDRGAGEDNAPPLADFGQEGRAAPCLRPTRLLWNQPNIIRNPRPDCRCRGGPFPPKAIQPVPERRHPNAKPSIRSGQLQMTSWRSTGTRLRLTRGTVGPCPHYPPYALRKLSRTGTVETVGIVENFEPRGRFERPACSDTWYRSSEIWLSTMLMVAAVVGCRGGSSSSDAGSAGAPGSAEIAALRRAFHLDLGESEAILVAESLVNAPVLMDERRGVKCARSRGVVVIRTSLIYAHAKLLGLVGSVQQKLDELRSHGFRLSNIHYEQILRDLGEL